MKSDNVTLSAQMVSAAERISQLEAVLVNTGQEIPPPPQTLKNIDFPAIAGDKFSAKDDDVSTEDAIKRLAESALTTSLRKRRRMSW